MQQDTQLSVAQVIKALHYLTQTQGWRKVVQGQQLCEVRTPRSSVGISLILWSSPSFLQDGCQRAKHHISTPQHPNKEGGEGSEELFLMQLPFLLLWEKSFPEAPNRVLVMSYWLNWVSGKGKRVAIIELEQSNPSPGTSRRKLEFWLARGSGKSQQYWVVSDSFT